MIWIYGKENYLHFEKGFVHSSVSRQGKSPSAESVKYLGLHLDSRPGTSWKTHILMKRNQLSIRLHDKNSKMSLENKILIYKAILKPVWTYGVQLWGVAAQSNIDIIQRVQSKVLRIITNASIYICKTYSNP